MRAVALASFALALALGGCTTQWDKLGASDADFARDDYQCEMAARGLPRTPTAALAAPTGASYTSGYYVAANSANAASASLLDAAISRRMYDRCMLANGWAKAD